MGAEVHNLKVGDKVWFVVPYCVQGEDTFAKKMYILHFVGSLSNYLVLEKEFVRKLPDELSFEGKYSSRSGN